MKGLYKPSDTSHKGENGRLLVIGGSKLFHASVFWSADVASKVVDLVHFSSPAEENNELVRVKLKEKFWNGIVVPFSKVEEYVEEDDCVLIGPGMPRNDGLMAGEPPTGKIVNNLLKKYSKKKWVVDGGALQEVDESLLNGNMIITPHKREWEMLVGDGENVNDLMESVVSFSKNHKNVGVVLKGKEDIVCAGEECVVVEGGVVGMTKGGTGDVLAGLIAALYCKNDKFLAAKVGSYVNKKAGENLSEDVGNYFNASGLVESVAQVISKI
ncbi:NAD(P)H-hydrate dehydratase [Patescibacteria group bacterium]